jgi:hypothetical protein
MGVASPRIHPTPRKALRKFSKNVLQHLHAQRALSSPLKTPFEICVVHCGVWTVGIARAHRKNALKIFSFDATQGKKPKNHMHTAADACTWGLLTKHHT